MRPGVWPRSLRSRYSLLLVLLVLVTQFLSIMVFLLFVQRPRMNDAAEMVAAQVGMLDRMLRSMPPQESQRYIVQLNAQRTPPVELEVPRFNRLMGFFSAYDLYLFLNRLTAALPQDALVRWQSAPQRRLWFRIHISGDPYWITLPNVESKNTSGWWSALLLSAALSAVALWLAWKTHRRLARPLTRLIKAARELGRGVRPTPLALEGPPEIVQASMTFNHMVEGLADLEEKRALMLAGISHDIRTPLTKLRLAIALHEGKGSEQQNYRRYFDDIDGILQQFIDFSRGEGGEPMVAGDINALLTALVQDFAGLGVPFALDLKPIPAFPWRQTSMLRLIMNLLQNAARYGEGEREVASGHHQGYAWIAIRDRGPGIATEELALISQPFHRGVGVQHSGAGLGLAICERIVTQHQGTMTLVNRAQGGLEVLFTLKMRHGSATDG
ncbi:hypothetical protein BTJ39_11940 [Izhakiella australiensis]|uniref:Sensor histidine kinase EnvZ n=1 Tax=Izhakiella australiensis TaxID=1926881 RepID=A0A1S8YL37_9GAMM|nr:ATP-binding protein [Izhakiella australiensis]OON39744.1 hypothetical protein BTJ39_11940 [Izhakiella australiensis]